MEWTDISSFSRDDNEHMSNWWSIKLGDFILRVGHKHIYYRDNPKWLMIFNRDHEVLGDKNDLTEEQAKEQALKITLSRLELAVDTIRNFTRG